MNIPDRPLYKFLSVDKNLTPPWRERVLALLSGKCYLSSGADFNDPFDCLPYVAAPSTSQERAEWVKYMVPLIADSVRQHIPAEFAYHEAQKIIEGVSDADLIRALKESSHEMADAMGVFCIAECLNSVLMWSHYASNHQGLALKFEFSQDSSKTPILWKVRYEDNRPTLRHTDFNVRSYAIAEALATKAKFWKYEQEWRIMQTDSARTVIDFDPSAIKGIVLGARCPSEVLEFAESVASARGLEITRMVPAERTFELETSVL